MTSVLRVADLKSRLIHTVPYGTGLLRHSPWQLIARLRSRCPYGTGPLTFPPLTFRPHTFPASHLPTFPPFTFHLSLPSRLRGSSIKPIHDRFANPSLRDFFYVNCRNRLSIHGPKQ